MAGSKVNDYGIGDQNIQSVMLSLDALFIGYCSLTLTNYDNDSEPAIAAGSKVEINGSLYKFDSEEAIGGSESSGLNYIVLIPSGDSVTVEYTDTVPTWSDSKQGWYGTGDNANNRYIADFWYYDSNYLLKYIYTKNDISKFSFRDAYIDMGTWNCDSVQTLSVSSPYGTNFFPYIVSLNGMIISDDGDISQLPYIGSTGSLGGGCGAIVAANNFVAQVDTGGAFDTTSYSSTSINRGYFIIKYDVN